MVEQEAEGDKYRAAAAAALADVDAIGAVGEDRSIVLKHMLHVRLPIPGSGAPAVGAAPSPPIQSPTAGSTPAASDEQDVLGRIGAVLKLDRDILELVYDVQDGEPQLVLTSKKLVSNKAQAARQLAQLVAAARQAAGLEEWTSVAPIRRVVSDYGRLDTNNFAAAIQQMDKVAVLRGKGMAREVKITKPGMEDTAALIRTLVGHEA